MVKLVNSTGTDISNYDYDIYGVEKEATEGTIKNPFRYSGEYYDEETGFYYLRARYYHPEIARFVSEDSYKGEINNPLTLNYYIYCVGNPIRYADPTGNKVWLIHGTWSNANKAWNNEFVEYIEGVFNESSETLNWNGKNNKAGRAKGAKIMAQEIYEWHEANPDEPIRLLGHSHGGNVAILIANILREKNMKVDTLVTIASPEREYQIEKPKTVGQHINVYNMFDIVQMNGGALTRFGVAGRWFDSAENIRVWLPFWRNNYIMGISNHSEMHNNIDIWKEYIEPRIKK